MSELLIRPGAESDLPALTDIYNHYIANTAITFDLEPYTVERRKALWFDHYHATGPHRLLVAEADGAIVGYATSSSFRPKAAYLTSVEASVYTHPEFRGKGLGTALYAALFDALKTEDVHRAYAGVTLPNDASIALHTKFGFQSVGVFREVGRKFGVYHDVAWLEKALG